MDTGLVVLNLVLHVVNVVDHLVCQLPNLLGRVLFTPLHLLLHQRLYRFYLRIKISLLGLVRLLLPDHDELGKVVLITKLAISKERLVLRDELRLLPVVVSYCEFDYFFVAIGNDGYDKIHKNHE